MNRGVIDCVMSLESGTMQHVKGNCNLKTWWCTDFFAWALKPAEFLLL